MARRRPQPNSTPLPDSALASLPIHLHSGLAYCRLEYDRHGKPCNVTLLYANPAFGRQTGLTSGSFASQPLALLSAQRWLLTLARVVESGEPENGDVYLDTLGGWYHVTAFRTEAPCFILLLDGLSAQRQAEAALQQRARQLQFVLAGSELGFWDWDIVNGTVTRNAQWAHMLGYTHEEMLHTTQQWSDFVHPDDRERAWASIHAALEGHSAAHKLEYRMLHKDGSVRWILDQAKVMQRDRRGRAIRMCGTHTDITQRKLLEEELLRQAHADYLTGVYNRRFFMASAEQALARSRRYGHPLSLLMLDADHFKQINDQHGHQAGDEALQQLARACQRQLRQADILGRIGGEEFAILLPDTELPPACAVAERVRQAVADLRLAGRQQTFGLTLSIGVGSYQPGDELNTLLNRADVALYQAKQAGRNRVCHAGPAAAGDVSAPTTPPA